MVLAQYYNFVRYGRDGYRYVMERMMRNTVGSRRRSQPASRRPARR
jgi:glutamate/tyrosine decarboxylase-like PLP-dependent enzyme